MFKGFFKNKFKKVRLGNIGRTILIAIVALVVIAAIVYLFFF